MPSVREKHGPNVLAEGDFSPEALQRRSQPISHGPKSVDGSFYKLVAVGRQTESRMTTCNKSAPPCPVFSAGQRSRQ
jgi:hypothetical protein